MAVARVQQFGSRQFKCQVGSQCPGPGMLRSGIHRARRAVGARPVVRSFAVEWELRFKTIFEEDIARPVCQAEVIEPGSAASAIEASADIDRIHISADAKTVVVLLPIACADSFGEVGPADKFSARTVLIDSDLGHPRTGNSCGLHEG